MFERFFSTSKVVLVRRTRSDGCAAWRWMPTIWKPGSGQMAERCGSRVAHDWRGYGAVTANRYCYDRGRGWPPIECHQRRLSGLAEFP
jgi:hypothetical protein